MLRKHASLATVTTHLLWLLLAVCLCPQRAAERPWFTSTPDHHEEMNTTMLSSNLLRRVASVSGRRLRNTSDVVVQARALSSAKFNDLEPLQKKENIIEVSWLVG